jgi:hypothetical protein
VREFLKSAPPGATVHIEQDALVRRTCGVIACWVMASIAAVAAAAYGELGDTLGLDQCTLPNMGNTASRA